ncbi:MAG: hypothetical protein ACRC4T_26355 [Cetobacterium sp.]
MVISSKFYLLLYVINPTMYYKMYDMIIKNEEIDLVQTGMNIINLRENKKIKYFLKFPKYTPNVCNKLFKRKIIIEKKIEFPLNIHMGEDLVFTEKYVSVSRKNLDLEENLYDYYLNSNSVSFNLKKRLEIYRSLDEIIKFMNNNKIKSKTKVRELIFEHGYEAVVKELRFSKKQNINLEYFILIMYFNILKYIEYFSLKDILYLIKIVTKGYIDKKIMKYLEK